MKATGIASSEPVAGEQALVQSAQDGASEAFAQLYDAYVERVYRYVYFRVSDDHVAEDITSAVFLKAWENLQRYRFGSSPFIAWLYRIAHNTVIDHYRDTRPMEPLETAAGQEIAMPDGQENGMEIGLDLKMTVEQLRNSLNHLTEKQQEVLTLRFIAGLSTAEIAKQIGKRQGAVHALQMRALKVLAAELGFLETENEEL